MASSPADQSRANPLFYGFIKAVLYIAYKIFFRVQFFGVENVAEISERRGVILAPNHASYLDPPIVGISVKRRVTYLAKEYLFGKFVVGWVLRSIGAFPIKTRSDDFRSVRRLIQILRDGKCVAIFPEGTRSPDGTLREAESGVGFLAVKSESVVVPVYIQGTFEAFPRGAKFFKCSPIKAHFGTPFVPSEDKEILGQDDPYSAVGKKIMAQIKALKEDAESRV